MSYGAASEDLRTEVADKLEAIVEHAETLLDDENADRQGIAETMIVYVDRVINELRRQPTNGSRPYYPMGEDK